MSSKAVMYARSFQALAWLIKALTLVVSVMLIGWSFS